MSSITVSASIVYGHSCKNLNEVGKHWIDNLSCDIHSMGHPPHLDRTSLEKFGLYDIAFRYNEMRDQAIITHSGEKWFINKQYLCDFGVRVVESTPKVRIGRTDEACERDERERNQGYEDEWDKTGNESRDNV